MTDKEAPPRRPFLPETLPFLAPQSYSQPSGAGVWRGISTGWHLRNVPVTPTPSIFPKVLPYKWEAYCSTNGRRTAGFPFLRSLEARKVRRYKWGAYCRTNWRCTAVLFRHVVGVGVPKHCPGSPRSEPRRNCH